MAESKKLLNPFGLKLDTKAIYNLKRSEEIIAEIAARNESIKSCNYQLIYHAEALSGDEEKDLNETIAECNAKIAKLTEENKKLTKPRHVSNSCVLKTGIYAIAWQAKIVEAITNLYIEEASRMREMNGCLAFAANYINSSSEIREAEDEASFFKSQIEKNRQRREELQKQLSFTHGFAKLYAKQR